MPIRYKTTTSLTEQVVGVQVWNGLHGTCETMPTEAWDRTREAADVLFERIVCGIDWSRVLLEASSRHFDLQRNGTHCPVRFEAFEDICGDCVQEALLSDEHSPRHDGKPAPRVDHGQDWLAVLTKMRQEYLR